MFYFDKLWICTEYDSLAFELSETDRGGEEYSLWAGHSYLPSNEKAEYIWMQYTGLKDKNGREIYEGDVLRCTSNFVFFDGRPTGEVSTETEQVVHVKDKAQFSVQTIDGNRPKGYINPFGINQDKMLRYYGVIGNIYENSELVAVKP